jgi:tight adherence protein C
MNLNTLPLNLPLILGFLGVGSLLALVASILLWSRQEAVRRRVLELGGMAGLGEIGTRSRPGPLSRLLAFAATLAPGTLKGRELRDLLAGAGFYGLDAGRDFLGTKVLAAVSGMAIGYGTGVLLHFAPSHRSLLFLAGGIGGFLLPSLWVNIRAHRRREEIRVSLPDALDLMVVCVEAGLGLNSALVRVGREIQWSCPPLSDELRLVNQEIRAGTPRPTALRNLSARVPIPDVQSLVAMFIQTDRLGTSIGRSLRVHADSLRRKRRQRAEENARKATIKLIFPLVLFIFPELLVVLLGPAGIQLLNTLRDLSANR